MWPCDVYGRHKVLAEGITRGSGPPWVIVRLGGVLPAEPRLVLDMDLAYLAGALPTDGRLHPIDVPDAA